MDLQENNLMNWKYLHHKKSQIVFYNGFEFSKIFEIRTFLSVKKLNQLI